MSTQYALFFDGNKTETQIRLRARDSRSRTERCFWGIVDGLRARGIVVEVKSENDEITGETVTASAFNSSPYSHSCAHGIWTLRRPSIKYGKNRRTCSSFFGRAHEQKRDEFSIRHFLIDNKESGARWDSRFNPAFTVAAGLVPTAASPIILL